jgi:hypothetical protein
MNERYSLSTKVSKRQEGARYEERQEAIGHTEASHQTTFVSISSLGTGLLLTMFSSPSSPEQSLGVLAFYTSVVVKVRLQAETWGT